MDPKNRCRCAWCLAGTYTAGWAAPLATAVMLHQPFTSLPESRGHIFPVDLVILPRRRGQDDYAANAATWDRNSNSIGLT
jgi:hypothetical protein